MIIVGVKSDKSMHTLEYSYHTRVASEVDEGFQQITYDLISWIN